MVFPVHDHNPTRRRAVVTVGLIVLNVVIFLREPLRASAVANRAACETAAFFARWAAIPAELTTNIPTARTWLGSVATGCAFGTPGYTKSPFLSVLSSMFLHAGWLHLLGNMLFLWIFGNNVEDRYGRLRFLLFYIGCGYVAAYAFALTFPHSTSPLIGASGAIAGVLGSYLVLYPRARVTTLVTIIPVRLPAWLVLGGWFLLQYWYSSGGMSGDSGVAYVAHVYGFIAGALVAFVVRRWAPAPAMTPSPWRRDGP